MATSNLRVVDWHLDSINYLLLVFFKRFSFVTVALIKFPFFGFLKNSGKNFNAYSLQHSLRQWRHIFDLAIGKTRALPFFYLRLKTEEKHTFYLWEKIQ